ncbi:MAG: PA14 domain-containing protein [Akkermansiaceae bacterium]
MTLSLQKALRLSLLLSCTSLCAEDGQTNYNTFCSACHSPDGKGASNGMFPALANSEWITGTPDRMTQVILHGLTGPIAAAGRNYDLVMPPQGGALTDEQIASIVSYVRASWGDDKSTITADYVKNQRELTKNQATMWDSAEILERYPIHVKSSINDLLSYAYKGEFTSLIELRAAEASSVEEEHGGLIAASQGGRPRDNFGVVWEGWMEAPEDGVYTFSYRTDKGGAVTINDEEIINRDNLSKKQQGAVTKGQVTLKKGRFDIKIEYYHTKGKMICDLSWNGPQTKNVSLTKTATKKKVPSILLTPVSGETIIHRNFFSQTDARGIAVGYAEGLNLLFSADSMSLDALWPGPFIDVGTMWTSRGKSRGKILSPLVSKVNSGLPVQVLSSPTSPWQKNSKAPLDAAFRGYQVNDKNQPTFHYEIGSIKFKDELIPSADGKTLSRTLTINTQQATASNEQVYFRLLNHAPHSQSFENPMKVDDNLTLELIKSTEDPIVRPSDIIIPISLNKSEQTIKLNYTWN